MGAYTSKFLEIRVAGGCRRSAAFGDDPPTSWRPEAVLQRMLLFGRTYPLLPRVSKSARTARRVVGHRKMNSMIVRVHIAVPKSNVKWFPTNVVPEGRFPTRDIGFAIYVVHPRLCNARRAHPLLYLLQRITPKFQ